MAKRLKVFQAQFGFHDSVVAVSSQAAALKAWGVRQNLFAEGQAKVTTDAAAVKAALAHPDTPLRRPVGSNGPFELEPSALPKLPAAKKAKVGKAEPKPAAPEPAPDRSALDKAEAALESLNEERRKEEAALDREQAALDRKIADAHAAYVDAHDDAAEAVDKARKAYRKAGGKD